MAQPDQSKQRLSLEEKSDLKSKPKTESASLYCADCGYDLTGLRSNKCPECGILLDFGDANSVTVDPNDQLRGTAKQIEEFLETTASRRYVGYAIVGFFALVAFFMFLFVLELLGIADLGIQRK